MIGDSSTTCAHLAGVASRSGWAISSPTRRSRISSQTSMTNSSRSRFSVSRHVVVVALQRDDAEGDVARLVLHDVVHDVAHQRLDRHLVHLREGGHGQAFDQDLHAEILQVPALSQMIMSSSCLRFGLIGHCHSSFSRR